jgi:hypothetical protein
MDLQHDGERIAVGALTAVDSIVARDKLSPPAQCDLLEIVLHVIDAHRDRLIEVHHLDPATDDL